MEFESYFRKATQSESEIKGRKPYPYQIRFAETTELPQLLNVPTGIGKTATAILGWLYRRRLHPDLRIRNQTPRRLVYCLPMRTLVEQTYRCAATWVTNLDLDGSVSVHLLMGGADGGDWDENPERDSILIGTQDMLLSRALNRGYGMSRYRWPMHFGLLNNDSLWVMDETQLMGVGLTTTAQLQGLRSKMTTYGVTQSLWMSATLDSSPIKTVDHAEPATGFVRQTLTDADRSHVPVQRRLTAQKPLERATVVLTMESEKKYYAKELAAEIRAAHQSGKLTLIVLNRVARAQELFNELKNLQKAKSKPASLTAELALIHARFRPQDRQLHEVKLFSETIPDNGRIVVATQAIEAGVDVSAATMFTELAPWPSLVQRFGRCNRGGEFPDARVIWIDAQLKDDKGAAPYVVEELTNSREFLQSLKDAGPAALELIRDERPVQVVHTLRRKDLLDLWDTTPDLAGNDLDISRFIREGDDNDVQFFWRDFDGDQPPETFSAAERHELCSVAVWRARDFLAKLKKNSKLFALVWKPLDRKNKWHAVEPDEVRPGMVLLLKASMGGYLDDIGWTGDATNKPTASSPLIVSRNEDCDDGANIAAKSWTTLTLHLNDVANASKELHSMFANSIAEIPWDAIQTAARWHDVGKAHPAFQNMLLRGRDDIPERRTTLWAKSDCTQSGRPRYFADSAEKDSQKDERIGFRHELASALAWLAHCGDQHNANLIAFLIASHHGKVRGSIRSLPNEIPPSNPDTKFARGVCHGDMLPPFDLSDKETVPLTTLDLSLMELGESQSGASWLARVLSLRDDKDLGPFRLSFLETLLRVADWRGSNAGETKC